MARPTFGTWNSTGISLEVNKKTKNNTQTHIFNNLEKKTHLLVVVCLLYDQIYNQLN